MATVTGSAVVGGVTYSPSANITLPVAGAITHGSQLTKDMTGPGALLGASWATQLFTPPPPTWAGKWAISATKWGDWPAPGFPTGAYVSNNSPSNHGGWVGAGGAVIDGYTYPQGTYVVQFMDLSAGSFYITDANFPIVVRGCKWRGPDSAPGFINTQGAFTGRLALHYVDAGGISAATAQMNEIPFKFTSGNGARLYRCYISYATTLCQFTIKTGIEVVENYLEKLTLFNPDSHLNGISINGGQTCAIVRRNKVLVPNPDDAGRYINQTDCLAMFQDDGAYAGTGTNADGTIGYQIQDNYWGGSGYVVYAGALNGAGIKNLKFTGNRWTTQWWPNSGYYGPLTATPVWGSNGNVQSDNLWADGPQAGQPI